MMNKPPQKALPFLCQFEVEIPEEFSEQDLSSADAILGVGTNISNALGQTKVTFAKTETTDDE
jgi:hypothetical protein